MLLSFCCHKQSNNGQQSIYYIYKALGILTFVIDGLENGTCDYIMGYTHRSKILWSWFFSYKIANYVIGTVCFRGFRVLAIYMHFGVRLKSE
jgi:hypothetical protein